MFGVNAVDCWTCAFLRFVTWMLIFILIYFYRDFLNLIEGKPAYFEFNLNMNLIPVFFYGFAVLSPLYHDIQHFTDKKKKLKEEANQPKTPVAGVDYWPNESDWPDSPDKPA